MYCPFSSATWDFRSFPLKMPEEVTFKASRRHPAWLVAFILCSTKSVGLERKSWGYKSSTTSLPDGTRFGGCDVAPSMVRRHKLKMMKFRRRGHANRQTIWNDVGAKQGKHCEYNAKR